MFFGRKREAKELADLVMAQRLVVVYAKSGMGKSSLINAALKEMLWEKGVLPLPVRLNDRDAGPLKTLYEGIDQAVKDRSVEHTPGTTLTLWHYFKTAEFWRGDLLLTPLLILDQFEELFTLQSPEGRELFIVQLAELIRGVRPSAQTEDGGRRLSDAPPDVKVLLSLREDYLGQLEELSTALPQILDTRFRLGPLFEHEARQAVEEPARLEDPRLETKPFKYAPEALDGIWAFLSRRRPGQVVESQPYVEPFQLQLVCQRAEEIARDLQKPRADGQQVDTIPHESQPARLDGGPVTVTWEALGKEAGLKTTLASFYERQLAALPSERAKRAARRLCEYGLISAGGRRLSLEEGEIHRGYKITRETLGKLVELRLFRADTRVGSIYYELSHDTLVEPILEGRRRRERRRFRVMSAGMGAVILVLGAAVLWLGLGEPAWERARQALLVRLTPETTQRALASELKWAQIPAPPGGQFMMGCVGDHDRGCSSGEKPRHPVKLSQGFEIMAHEVTMKQFTQFINAIGSTFVGRWLLPGHDPGAQDDHPVVDVSWFDAAIFCAVVGGRLPTEAEWEYAARGGKADAIYPWGNKYSDDQANARGKQGRDRWERIAPVGSFPANSFGLFDMVGNAWEWTSSVYEAYPYQSDGGRESSLSGKARVVRGGSWGYNPVLLRVSGRSDVSPSNRLYFVGFRCARDGSP